MLARQAVLAEPSLWPTSQSSPDPVYPCHLGLFGLTHSLEVARVVVTPGPLSAPESASPSFKLHTVTASCGESAGLGCGSRIEQLHNVCKTPGFIPRAAGNN